MSKKIEQQAQQLVEKIIDKDIYELVDVEYVKENSQMYLRILIDKDGKMTLEDCEKLSKDIGDKLDEEDFIQDSYYLEISSPGIDRTLKKDKDFEREKGKLVIVKLFKAIDMGKEFVAMLEGIDENKNILLDVDGKKISLEKKSIAKINLYVEI